MWLECRPHQTEDGPTKSVRPADGVTATQEQLLRQHDFHVVFSESPHIFDKLVLIHNLR